MNLLNSYRSEWILLNRRKMWMVMGLTTATAVHHAGARLLTAPAFGCVQRAANGEDGGDG